MNTKRSFDPRSYWEERLRAHPDLQGVGHRRFSISYNRIMYQVAIHNLNLMLDKVELSLAHKEVLDIGPGLGHFIEFYLTQGATGITGLDITEISVDLLRSRYPQHSFICADVSEFELPLAHEYDVVSAINVLFHITHPSRFKQAIKNICQATKPNGYIIMADSLYKRFAIRTTHAYPRTISEYMPLLRELDFEILLIYPMYFLMGQSTLPIILPNLLSHPVLLKWLQKSEIWLSRFAPKELSSMQYLIAQRKG